MRIRKEVRASTQILSLLQEASVTLRQVLTKAPHARECTLNGLGTMDPIIIACNCWRRGAAETWVKLSKHLAPYEKRLGATSKVVTSKAKKIKKLVEIDSLLHGKSKTAKEGKRGKHGSK